MQNACAVEDAHAHRTTEGKRTKEGLGRRREVDNEGRPKPNAPGAQKLDHELLPTKTAKKNSKNKKNNKQCVLLAEQAPNPQTKNATTKEKPKTTCQEPKQPTNASENEEETRKKEETNETIVQRDGSALKLTKENKNK